MKKYLVQYFPHGLQVLLGLAVLDATWVLTQQANGNLSLPGWVIVGATLVKTGAGLFSDSVQSVTAKLRALRAKNSDTLPPTAPQS